MPTRDGLTEADVTISGRALTFAQVMALRVAVGSFRIQLTDEAFRDGLGERLASNYDAHLAAVEWLLLGGR